MKSLPPLGAYLGTSFLDWPERVAAVFFVQGCNFSCPFCHNGELVNCEAPEIDIDVAVADCARRAAFLDGVVVSGGEPTIHASLVDFVSGIKNETGLDVKLDTNGSNPSMLKHLLGADALKYVAMDIKGPWDSYDKLAGVHVDVSAIRESARMLRNSGVSYEFRTTWVPELMTLEELAEARKCIDYDNNWIIQCFRPGATLDPSLSDSVAADPALVREHFPGVAVRG